MLKCSKWQPCNGHTVFRKWKLLLSFNHKVLANTQTLVSGSSIPHLKHGRFLPPVSSLVCFSPGPTDSLLIRVHSVGGTDSHSRGPITPEPILVPVSEIAAVGGSHGSSCGTLSQLDGVITLWWMVSTYGLGSWTGTFGEARSTLWSDVHYSGQELHPLLFVTVSTQKNGPFPALVCGEGNRPHVLPSAPCVNFPPTVYR